MTKWYEELGITGYYFADDNVCIIHGDCREQSLSGISAVVTDPPYELGFMGKSWDSKGVSFQKETWEKIRSYCLPGSPLLSFGGSRTQHRIACAIEDAGWEIRDCLQWVYGSGFPKSLDIGKAIDKTKDAEREVIAISSRGSSAQPNKLNNHSKGDTGIGYADGSGKEFTITSPATPEAKLWDGWGTALKPAYEPIILGMNPLDKTFANNALRYGVAGLNIDECRVPTGETLVHGGVLRTNSGDERQGAALGMFQDGTPNTYVQNGKGRFPANFLHDGSGEVLALFPNSKTSRSDKPCPDPEIKGYKWGTMQGNRPARGYSEDGSAARFFYCAKASRSERLATNNHPTVKPLALMEYLCKLVKMPEHNIILDPFCGSGTTLLACKKLGIKVIGIDSDEQSCEIATIRYLRSLPE